MPAITSSSLAAAVCCLHWPRTAELALLSCLLPGILTRIIALPVM